MTESSTNAAPSGGGSVYFRFNAAGLPLGGSFSFLISSPIVDLGSLVLLLSLIHIFIIISAVILAVLVVVFAVFAANGSARKAQQNTTVSTCLLYTSRCV